MSQYTSGPTGSLEDVAPVPTTTEGSASGYPDASLADPAYPEAYEGSSAANGSTTERAKDVAQQKADVVKDEAQGLAQTTKEELGNVGSTATEQMRRLVDQSTSELSDQARTQQQRLTSNLRSLTDQLDTMASSGDQQGLAHDLVRQASQQARAFGDWLDGRDPAAVLDEVKRFARRKPGTFLAVAAGIGFLSGRLTRGLTADSGTTGGARSTTGTTGVTGMTGTTGTGTMVGTSSVQATPPVSTTETYPAPGSTLPIDEPPIVEPEYGTGYSGSPLHRGETR